VFLLSARETGVTIRFRSVPLSKQPGGVSSLVTIRACLTPKDLKPLEVPAHVPDEVAAILLEGNRCCAAECFNAAATMFRLCVDLATRMRLPEEDVDGLNAAIRRSLGLRLNWLFEGNRLPSRLRDLASCIKDDGNDGAHAGRLSKEEAEDLRDFTITLLEEIYTGPQKVRNAQNRRDARRQRPSGNE
jgi:hypothetical protein